MDPIKVLSSSIACFGVMALATPNPANAAYDPSKPGYTEVINCPTSSFTNFWGHSSSQWGSSGSWISNDTGTAWWSYASTGDLGSTSCGQWTNGTPVGGATCTPGTPSVPQGVTAKIATYWYDFNQPGDWTVEGNCGHQHTSSYVWGWRYFGSSWGFEFVDAHAHATYWDSAAGRCKIKAAGNPESPPPFAFGDEVISIPNSPYVVLYTKSQATSHYTAGCGELECYHRVLTIGFYE